ncbi:MAG TPA: DUF4133 domain-containing protein [Anditalea sp.]|nr:DUF4133 domain-containing protein [Anditalea sp.]
MKGRSFRINKGVNKPMEFKGLKAQYIWYMAIGLGVSLLLFSVLYFLGISLFFNAIISVGLCAGIYLWVFRLNKEYGEHGMMKLLARRQVPMSIRIKNRSYIRNIKSFKQQDDVK